MTKSVDEQIGERVYQLRISRGMSQRQLAKTVNISRDSIRDWELQKSFPSANAIALLAEYFDVPADYLLGLHLENWIHIGHLPRDQMAVIRQMIRVFEEANKRQ